MVYERPLEDRGGQLAGSGLTDCNDEDDTEAKPQTTIHLADQRENDEEVILVDEHDNPVGSVRKLEAHENGGILHRAFSIFVLDGEGRRILLQRRSKQKYHFGGLWTNSCCGHPRRDETTASAAFRRLYEEFGFSTSLEEFSSFVYRAEDPNTNLVEHEFDHVFAGYFDGDPRPDPAEIEDWKWIELNELSADLRDNSNCYTPWFAPAFETLCSSLPSSYYSNSIWGEGVDG